MYKSSLEVSELAEFDFGKSGFQISYLKNGIIQPQILDDERDTANQLKKYYTGSSIFNLSHMGKGNRITISAYHLGKA